jgi:predicted glycosyltransferase
MRNEDPGSAEKVMKILIDIGHPAHVHYFRNLALIFQKKGSAVLFTTRDKEVAIQLLNHYNFDYVNFGRPFKSRTGKIIGLFWFTLKLLKVALKFKPDMVLNATQYSAVVAWLLRKPHISLEDTFNMEQVRLYMPFSSVVLTGNYAHPDIGKKQIKYSGYQELAYLHPARFTPDPRIREVLGVGMHDKYVILRFVAWGASHDYGHKGIAIENKYKAVKEFANFARVFISAEGSLPIELENYRLKIPPEKMHDVLAFASLIFSESATMVSEAAVLGVPGIYIDSTGRYYTKDQEKFGMVFNFSESLADQEKAIKKGVELLKMEDTKKEFSDCHQRMLAGKIDVTAFFVWFVENLPESAGIMKKNPEYQLSFK